MNLLSKIIRKIRKNKFKKELEKYNSEQINIVLSKHRDFSIYYIERISDDYIVWKEKYKIQSVGVRSIFTGTYKECKKFCKENKIELGRRIYAE